MERVRDGEMAGWREWVEDREIAGCRWAERPTLDAHKHELESYLSCRVSREGKHHLSFSVCLNMSFVSSSLCPTLVIFCHRPVFLQLCFQISYNPYHDISLAWIEEFISVTVHSLFSCSPRWQDKQNPIAAIGSLLSANADLPSRGEQRSGARPAPGSTAKHHGDRRLRHKRGWLNLIKQRLFVCAARAVSIKSRQKRVDAEKRVGTYAGEVSLTRGGFLSIFVPVLFYSQNRNLNCTCLLFKVII